MENKSTATEVAQVTPSLFPEKPEIGKASVNGVSCPNTANDIRNAVRMALKQAIMRAQGADYTFYEGLGWVKNQRKVLVVTGVNAKQLTVPEWDPTQLTYNQWKAKAINGIAKGLQQIDRNISVSVAQMAADCDEIVKGAATKTAAVEEKTPMQKAGEAATAETPSPAAPAN